MNHLPPFEDDDDLPVAVPVRNYPRRRRVFLRRGEDHGHFHNEDDDVDMQMPLVEELDALVAEQDFRPRRRQQSTPYLLDLIREGLPCVSVLAGPRVRGCNVIVERCQQNPGDVFYHCFRTGRSALHEAAIRCSCLHVFRAILQVDPTRTMMGSEGHFHTPLHLLFLGISGRRVNPEEVQEIVQLLLQPAPQAVADVMNRDRCSPLHYACSVPESMVPFVAIERLLEASLSSAGRLNNKSQTPLHLHCQRKNASVILAARLLEAAPESILMTDGSPNDDGCTPLHHAAANCNVELIQFLVSSDPRAVTALTVASRRTVLHVLCRQHLTDDALPCISAILQVAPEIVSRVEPDTGYTPLHILCRSKHIPVNVLRVLVQASPDAVKIRDLTQYLPVHYAAESGAHSDVLACLLVAYSDAAAATTRKQDTALSLACASNQSPSAVKLLLKTYAAATQHPNIYGFVPLHCVCRAFQPKLEIVQALVAADPSSVTIRTHAGEAAVHIASRNVGCSMTVLELLNQTLESLIDDKSEVHDGPFTSMTTKIGNTPLHLVCFRGLPLEQIENLAVSNPAWITTRNNAGYTPLQILSKNGRLDDRIVTLFSRICGPEIFASVDLMGNTPLHSAMRAETGVDALRALIRAYPDALHMKTAYDDTPLHLACLRGVHPDVLREVAVASSEGLESALASSNGRLSPLLLQNTAGQTPIGIAMEDYQRSWDGRNSCYVKGEMGPTEHRAFLVLASLVRILHYGPVENFDERHSLVRACVSLHRMDARLDPAFIRRALLLYPEEAKLVDENGNYPLHIEASIPVEKMALLDSTSTARCCGGTCQRRMGVLRALMDIYPEAAQHNNSSDDLPLCLMIQNGRAWDSTLAVVLSTFPQAIHHLKDLSPLVMPNIFAKVGDQCGTETVFQLIRSRPGVVVESDICDNTEVPHELVQPRGD